MKMPLPWFSSPSSQKNKAQERITLQRNRIFAKKEANKKQFWTKLQGCSCCCIGKDIDNTSREPPKNDQTLTTLSFNSWMKLHKPHHQTHLFVAHLPCQCWICVFCHSWPCNPCAYAYFPFVNGRCHLKGSMPFFSSELHSLAVRTQKVANAGSCVSLFIWVRVRVRVLHVRVRVKNPSSTLEIFRLLFSSIFSFINVFF